MMTGFLRRLGVIVAMLALLAVPLSEAAIAMPPMMDTSTSTGRVLDTGSKMNSKVCGQRSAGSAVCSANSCAIFGILADTAIALEPGQLAFLVMQAVAPKEFALTPPIPPA